MSTLLDSVNRLVTNEPLLTRVGPVLLAVVAYLATKAYIDTDTANLITAVLAALIGGTGLVTARALVTPDAKK